MMILFVKTSAADVGVGIAFDYLYDDNVNKSGTSSNSDTAAGAKLNVQAAAQISKFAVGMKYGSGIVRYSKYSQYNHEDHTLSQYLNYQGVFVGWRTEINYMGSHDERGAPGTTTNFSDTPVLYQSLGGTVRTSYEGGDEIGKASLSFGAIATRYPDSVQAFRNNNTFNFAGSYTTQLTGKTSVVSKFGVQRYSSVLSSLIAEDRSYSAASVGFGVSWAATGKLTGHALVGAGWNKAALSKYGSSTNGNTDIQCVWQRKSYSSVSVSLVRSVGASATQTDVVSINNMGALGLNHTFSDRFSVNAGLNVMLNEFRNDKSSLFYGTSLGAKYSPLNKLSMVLTVRSSTGGNGLSQLKYVSNVVMASVATSI